MKITLELWDDQSGMDDNIDTSMWIFKIEGKDFPNKRSSLMTLSIAHKIVNKLCEIEEMVNMTYE
jgi:hypothetical protein